jgi:hypothetical protein
VDNCTLTRALQASLLRKSAQREYDERVMIAIGATRVALPGRISFEAIAHYVYAGATTLHLVRGGV